jgi:rRNA processing protein Krr1/Pno1
LCIIIWTPLEVEIDKAVDEVRSSVVSGAKNKHHSSVFESLYDETDRERERDRDRERERDRDREIERQIE